MHIYCQLQTFLSQKYGDPLLPCTISREEFKVILGAVYADQQRHLAHLAELAAKLEEEEKKRQEAREAILEASRAQQESAVEESSIRVIILICYRHAPLRMVVIVFNMRILLSFVIN